jgi:hypothetical protein
MLQIVASLMIIILTILKVSLMLLESSIMLLENIYSTGVVTHDDHHKVIKIFLLQATLSELVSVIRSTVLSPPHQ